MAGMLFTIPFNAVVEVPPAHCEDDVTRYPLYVPLVQTRTFPPATSGPISGHGLLDGIHEGFEVNANDAGMADCPAPLSPNVGTAL